MKLQMYSHFFLKGILKTLDIIFIQFMLAS